MRIHGSVCALATPFGVDGQLDLAGFSRLIKHQLDGGTQALLVAGSTGEAHLLSSDEYDRLLEHAVERIAGQVPVLAGCGSADTPGTVRACRRAAELGADAVLVVTPYYVRPDQRGLLHHFRTVADASPVPIILYNVPARTGCDMQPDTVAALCEHPHIIGIKEAVADPQRLRAMAALAGEDFVYLSGDDGSAVAAMQLGAAGTISVAVNAAPRLFRALCDAARGDGDGDGLPALEQRFAALLDALACGPNPVPIKAALAIAGICTEQVRSPLLVLPDGEARAQLAQALARAEPG